MRAAQGDLFGKTIFLRRKVGFTNFAANLPGFTIVTVEIRLRSATAGAAKILWDITRFMAGNGLNHLSVSEFVIRDQETPIPVVLMNLDFGQSVHLKFLIFWRMRIVESPLLKRDVSADKTDQPAVLLIKVLN